MGKFWDGNKLVVVVLFVTKKEEKKKRPIAGLCHRLLCFK
jgi:hypothetical protein